ncbi:MAG TPA: glycosyltransferase family 39 protein [Chloroflexota bacterium]
MSPRVARVLVPGALAVVVLVLATWNLSTVPPTWYDEGINLQAARNLARFGQYGLVYSAPEGVRLFDLQQTTGPTIVAPVALAFKLFGLGLTQARSVMVLYSLAAAAGLFVAARQLYGNVVAVMAVLVLCATNEAGPAATHDVVGEIAGVAFFVWAIAVWATKRWYIVSGLLFGLAVLSKGQFGLVLPAIAAAWLFTRANNDGISARQAFTLGGAALAMIGAWQLTQLVVLTPGGYFTHLTEQSRTLSISSAVTPLSKTQTAIYNLLISRSAIIALSALAYVAVSGVRRCASAERMVAIAFSGMWLVWFLVMSTGFTRYAIPLVAVCSLFAAELAHDLLRLPRLPRLIRTLVALGMASFIVVSIGLRIRGLTMAVDSGAAEFAAIILREVPAHIEPETIEWQLDILTERSFHHPLQPAILPYAVPPGVEYLVDGPMSKAFNIYTALLEERPFERVVSIGEYDLYRRSR